MQTNQPQIKVAILDLNDNTPNKEIGSFQDILNRFRDRFQLNLSYEVFDVRGKKQVPGVEFDLYISSGGPGSPVDSEGSEWEGLYFDLIYALEAYNRTNNPKKKHVLFICHSFQLMCRKYKLGDLTMRRKESFGIFPMSLTEAGKSSTLMDGLEDPFYAVDSRQWQVVNPHRERFTEIGAKLLALEKERPHIDLPRAMMAIQFNEFFFGTQFHPEADPIIMKTDMLKRDTKQAIISEYGEQRYNSIMKMLEHPEEVMDTQSTIITNFLNIAVQGLREMNL